MVATTARFRPQARSPSAIPTAAGTPQPIPPLAVAKNPPERVVGSQRSCWAIVDVDSVTSGESAGLTVANVENAASGVSGDDAASTISVVLGLALGAGCADPRSLIKSTSCSRTSRASPIRLSPTGAAPANH